MKSNRRRFIRDTGLVGLAAATSGSLVSQAAVAADGPHPDPTVKKVAGPYGEGMPITAAGYDYNRVAAVADGRVTIEGCATTYEVTSIGPLNIHWVETGKDSAANLTGGVSSWEKVRPDGLEITNAPEHMDESDLLLAGDVDAIFHPAEPRVYQERNPAVRRLFEDFRSVEQDYYKRTGIFPIMHSIAIRRDVMEDHPWLPKAVFEAYSKSKALNLDHMHKLGWAYDSLPWYGQEYNNTIALMGRNIYPYGYEGSAKSYDTACRYLHEQGLSKHRVTLDELFGPSLRELNE